MFETIAALDGAMFDAFNHAALPKSSGSTRYFAPDVEFYHDTGGVTWTLQEMIANTEKNVCGKFRRELVLGSLEVFQVKEFWRHRTGRPSFLSVRQPTGARGWPISSSYGAIKRRPGRSRESSVSVIRPSKGRVMTEVRAERAGTNRAAGCPEGCGAVGLTVPSRERGRRPTSTRMDNPGPGVSRAAGQPWRTDMRSRINVQNRLHFVRATSVASAVRLGGRGQAFGETAAAPVAVAPTVVLAGGSPVSFKVIPSTDSGPDPEPIEYATRTLVSVGFSATGASSLRRPWCRPSAFQRPRLRRTRPHAPGGDAVAGRRWRRGRHSFDGGTVDDCRTFAETVRAAARRLGCAVSGTSINNPLPLYGGGAQFSLVCEGPADQAIHAIGELDRVTLTLEAKPAE